MTKHSVTLNQKTGLWLVVGPGSEPRAFITHREAWREADKRNGEAISVGEDWSHYAAKPR